MQIKDRKGTCIGLVEISLCVIKNVYLHLFFLMQPKHSRRDLLRHTGLCQEGQLPEMRWTNKLGKSDH